MINNSYDLYGQHGERAIIYAAAARRGHRVEIGLQVWNPQLALWQKMLTTQLPPDDTLGICFEYQRLIDKALDAGFSPYDHKSVAYHIKEAGMMVDELDDILNVGTRL